MEEKIQTRLVIEILGRPPEHIEESLNTLVVKMGSEKGVEIKEKNYHKPKKIEKSEDLYTAFAEIEADFDTLEGFFSVIFNYLPANVEILSPGNVKMKIDEINSFSNFILGKLHNYDALAKRFIAERDILIKRLEHETGKKISELFSANENEKTDKKIEREK